jgi:alkyl hydroperoxide reductase subunit AhpC
MSFAKYLLLITLLCTAGGCGDNIIPSDEDKRPPVQSGTTGSAVGQNAPEFSVPATTGADVTLASALAGKKGAVLYFTMWCPTCDSHMSHMLDTTIPSFPDVTFVAVDYISGSIAETAGSAAANGYAGTAFTIVADIGHPLQQGYQGTMGTTVVIDRNGIIRMNEDYRDGSRLQSVLASLQ